MFSISDIYCNDYSAACNRPPYKLCYVVLLGLDFWTSDGALPYFFCGPLTPFLFSSCLSSPRCAEFIPLRNHGRVVEARKNKVTEKGLQRLKQYFSLLSVKLLHRIIS